MLLFRLLPYLMSVGGLVGLAVFLSIVILGAETQPTPIPLAEVSAKSPKQDWLRVTGGGLHVADASFEEESKKDGSNRRIKAWYVPLVTAEQAFATEASAVLGQSTLRGEKLILVQFTPKEFNEKYPNAESGDTPPFRVEEVEGLRRNKLLLSDRLKNFVRDELKVQPENVVVLQYGDKPIQRSQALIGSGACLAVMVLGLFWAKSRWSSPKAPAIPQMPTA